MRPGALFLNSLLFNWKLHHSPLCQIWFSTDETNQHVFFDCQAQSEETISLKCFCSLARIPNIYTAILNSNLSWDIDCKIFKAYINILKKRNIVWCILKHEDINLKGYDLGLDFDWAEESRRVRRAIFVLASLVALNCWGQVVQVPTLPRIKIILYYCI